MEQVPGVAQVRRLRSRRAIDRLDELRAMRGLGEQYTQNALALELHISQPAVSKALEAAAAVDSVLPGFSGASPYEVAQRYAAGELSREQLVDELARWPYRPVDPGDGVDWNSYVPSDFADVTRALSHGLIDDETYCAILTRQNESGL